MPGCVVEWICWIGCFVFEVNFFGALTKNYRVKRRPIFSLFEIGTKKQDQPVDQASFTAKSWLKSDPPVKSLSRFEPKTIFNWIKTVLRRIQPSEIKLNFGKENWVREIKKYADETHQWIVCWVGNNWRTDWLPKRRCFVALRNGLGMKDNWIFCYMK